jgi:hypothetical protein
MGDLAGRFGFELPVQLLQLEGLVADRKLIEHIRSEDDLVEVLRGYRVDYLVSCLWTRPVPDPDGCQTVQIPHPKQASSYSKAMVGQFCAPPVFQTTPNGEFLDVYCDVFRVPP